MATESDIVWRFAPYNREGYAAAIAKKEEAEAEKRAEEENISLPRLSQPKRIKNSYSFEPGITVKGLFPSSGVPEDATEYNPNDPNIKINAKLGGYAFPAQITFKSDGLVVRQEKRGKSMMISDKSLPKNTKSEDEHFVRLGVSVEGVIFEGIATHIPQPKLKELTFLPQSS